LDNYGPVRVEYAEGIFIGYRWDDAKGLEPLFPFGHGLSYTRFELGATEVSEKTLSIGESLTVRVPVTNIGERAGAEVVQLYVEDVEASVPRPPRELKGFAKVWLEPGEAGMAEFTLTPRDFRLLGRQGSRLEDRVRRVRPPRGHLLTAALAQGAGDDARRGRRRGRAINPDCRQSLQN
jgi:hypothetical protein